MTIEHHPRPFGARIVDGVKVAALLFVLSVIVAAADRTLVSPDAVELGAGFTPSESITAAPHGDGDAATAASDPSQAIPGPQRTSSTLRNGH
jgi:hypothetical protein